MNFKFLSPFFGLISGIYFSSNLANGLGFAAICIGISVLIWTGITIASKNYSRGLRFISTHHIWIFILFTGIGALDFHFRSEPHVERNIKDSPCNFQGVIEEVNPLAEGDRFIVRIKNIFDSTGRNLTNSNLKILLKTNGYSGSKGDIISFEGIPKEFSKDAKWREYAEKMKNMGIPYFVNVNYRDIHKTGSSGSLLPFLNNIREKFIILLEKSSLERPTVDFLISILLGDKTYLNQETRQTLSSAGIAHILALSGLHVAIIFSIILFIFFPLSLLGHRKIRQIIALILIWTYILFTGAAPSTVRAGIMLTFIVVAFILERKNSAINSLFAAIFLILLYNPISLWDIGLQLSFLCVVSILLFTQKLNVIDHHIHPKSHKIYNLILVTLITTVTTWTVMAYYFKTIPLLSLPVNLIVLPLLPIFIGCGLFYLILLSLGQDLYLLRKTLDLFYNSLIGVTDTFTFSGTSHLTVNISSLSVFLWLTGIVGLVITLHSTYKKNKKYLSFLSCALLIFSLTTTFIKNDDASDSIKFVHSFTKLEAHLFNRNENSKFEFPRQSVSELSLDKHHILAIDRYVKPDYIELLKSSANEKRNYLFVGPAAAVHQIAEIVNNQDFHKIILHPGVGKNKKAELLHLLSESNWDKVYSMRDNGSLELDL